MIDPLKTSGKLLKTDGMVETVDVQDCQHLLDLIGGHFIAERQHKHVLIVDDEAVALGKPVNAKASALVRQEVRGNAIWMRANAYLRVCPAERSTK